MFLQNIIFQLFDLVSNTYLPILLLHHGTCKQCVFLRNIDSMPLIFDVSVILLFIGKHPHIKLLNPIQTRIRTAYLCIYYVFSLSHINGR